jgi:hypothetical protein
MVKAGLTYALLGAAAVGAVVAAPAIAAGATVAGTVAALGVAATAIVGAVGLSTGLAQMAVGATMPANSPQAAHTMKQFSEVREMAYIVPDIINVPGYPIKFAGAGTEYVGKHTGLSDQQAKAAGKIVETSLEVFKFGLRADHAGTLHPALHAVNSIGRNSLETYEATKDLPRRDLGGSAPESSGAPSGGTSAAPK